MTQHGLCDGCCFLPPHLAVQYCNTNISTIEVVDRQVFVRLSVRGQSACGENVAATEFEHVDSLTMTADTTTSWLYVNFSVRTWTAVSDDAQVTLDGVFIFIDNDIMRSAVAGEPASIPLWPGTGIRPVFSSLFLPSAAARGSSCRRCPRLGADKGGPAPAHDFRGRCETLWTGTLSNMPRGIKYMKGTRSSRDSQFFF